MGREAESPKKSDNLVVSVEWLSKVFRNTIEELLGWHN
jgi:hypothetical protein